MRTKLNVGLAQIAPKMGDVRGNLEKLIGKVREAKKRKADVVVFPELATVGYLSQGIFLEAPERSRTHFRTLIRDSRGIHIILGLVEETDHGILHNAGMIVNNGKIIEGSTNSGTQRAYRKCYPPTYGMFDEMRWFAPGTRVPVFTLNVPSVGQVKTSIVICEDFWHPLPAAIASMRGAQFINAIAASPKTLDKPRIVDALLKARAIENVTYMVFVNAVGSQDMVNFWGGSKIIGPEGEVLVEASQRQEELIVGEIDLYRLRKLRQSNPLLRDERRELIEDYYEAFKAMRGINP